MAESASCRTRITSQAMTSSASRGTCATPRVWLSVRHWCTCVSAGCPGDTSQQKSTRSPLPARMRRPVLGSNSGIRALGLDSDLRAGATLSVTQGGGGRRCRGGAAGGPSGSACLPGAPPPRPGAPGALQGEGRRAQPTRPSARPRGPEARAPAPRGRAGRGPLRVGGASPAPPPPRPRPAPRSSEPPAGVGRGLSCSPEPAAERPTPLPRTATMGPSSLWALLLLPAGVLAQGCPADCQCNQPRTVFCISRRSHTVPRGLPPDTASLYVFENGIRALSEDSFAETPDLQLLDLSQNQLQGLPPSVFQPLRSLCNLDLSSNRLREVTNETFHGLRRLERLYLDHNLLRHLHAAAFSSLESLLELKLQDNQLQALPPLSLPTLLLLDVSRNRVAALQPGTFRSTHSLESLKLAGLGLGRLDDEVLQGLRSLHELDLSGNLLAQVPRGLGQLRGLTKLSLAGNGQIAQLQAEDFRELQQLQELDISKLSLRGLPRDFFAAFPRLRAVSAAENPFNCACQLSWLVPWLSTGQATLRRSEETRCHFPPKNAGRLLQHLQYADFGCPTTTTLRATSPRPATPAPSSRRQHGPATPSAASATPAEGGPTAPTPTSLGGDPSPETRLCPPHTCLNGGVCQLDPQHHLQCACPPGFSGLYCETQVWATPPPGATLAPTRPPQVAIQHVGSTSLKVDLQPFAQSKTQLKGIRLTYRNLSGPDKRPVTLRLPASLAEYTVRALKPNSSYHICIGPLGAPEEELCVQAQTLQLTQQQQQQTAAGPQGRDPSLAVTVLPVVAAVLLLVAAVAAAWYYVRRRRKGKAPAPPAVSSASPLELERVKAGLGNRDLAGHGQSLPEKAAVPHGLEYEVPLMQPHHAGAGTPRAPRPSYF